MIKYYYFIILLICSILPSYSVRADQNIDNLDMPKASIILPFSTDSVSLDLSIPIPPILIENGVKNESIQYLKYIVKLEENNNRIYIEGIRLYLFVVMFFIIITILLIKYMMKKNIYIQEDYY